MGGYLKRIVKTIDQSFYIALYLNVIRIIFLYASALGIVSPSLECLINDAFRSKFRSHPTISFPFNNSESDYD